MQSFYVVCKCLCLFGKCYFNRVVVWIVCKTLPKVVILFEICFDTNIIDFRKISREFIECLFHKVTTLFVGVGGSILSKDKVVENSLDILHLDTVADIARCQAQRCCRTLDDSFSAVSVRLGVGDILPGGVDANLCDI